MAQLKSESPTWHLQNWGTWGWAETALKLIGIAAVVFGLLGAVPGFGLTFALNARLIAVILLALLSLLSLVIISIRFGQREIIAFAFSILNALGHISALLLLLQPTVIPHYPAVFAITYLLGEATKYQFLKLTGYTESGRDQKAMLQLPTSLIVIYLLIAIFVWF
jgi:hypothetical protein